MKNSDRVDVAILGAGIVGLYVARALVDRGKKVALVDRGPLDIRHIGEPLPRVHCPERQHMGLLRARNHVFGGNSHFWGGGLIRDESEQVARILGADAEPEFSKELAAWYGMVERNFDLPRPGRRSVLELPLSAAARVQEAEIFVVPGRKRNISLWNQFKKHPNLSIYSRSKIRHLHRSHDGRIQHVEVEGPDTKISTLYPDTILVTMGVIDSNLFAIEFADQLGLGSNDLLGTRLHDHWSVPLFNVYRDGRSSKFVEDFAPHFEKGFIVGKHLEVRNDDPNKWDAGGFLHFQFLFDHVAPYREIKTLLGLRQRGPSARVSDYMLGLWRAGKYAIPLAQIALDKILFERLYIADNVPIVAVLDFESFPSTKNRLEFGSDPVYQQIAHLHWDIRREDVESFEALFGQSKNILEGLAYRYGIRIEAIEGLQSLSAYLQDNVTDAYHLGGGLRAGSHENGGIVRSYDLSVRGVPNMHVISTAIFRRSGRVNPTHTLLALAERFVHHV